jgi:hypothetical protein
MDAKDRMESWKNLPLPKPTWEDFKVMLRHFNNDPFKAHEAFQKKLIRRQSQENSNHGQDF